MIDNSQQQTTSVHPIISRLYNFLTNDLVLVWGIVFLAWMVMLLMFVTGQDWLHDHDPMSEKSPPLLLKLLIFILAWQVMVVAMMLPSSLPLLRLLLKVSQQQTQEKVSSVLIVFICAYATVWTGFALLNFLAGWGLHHLIHSWFWLDQRTWLISGTTLLIAGVFQFSGLKQHCLKYCRHPLSFLTHHYQRGLKAAWSLGIRHGLYCLGCCWALMLVMFAVGIEHLGLMLGLTGVMVIEKTSPWSGVLVKLVGIGLVIWGTLTFAHLLTVNTFAN